MKCTEEDNEAVANDEASSVDSLKIGFVPYEGYKREKANKFPHIFDVRSKTRMEKLHDKLKDIPQGTDKNGIEVQLEKSEACLQELLDFGNELVHNIKSASEQQELLQTQQKNQKAAELQKEIAHEAAETLRHFDAINAKWRDMNEMREPMAIFEEMQKQRDNIAQMMASKDELIAKCQMELKKIGEKYNADQEKQSQDVCFLVERIDDQIELLKKSYAENINELQDAIDKERKKIHEAAKGKWSRLYEHLTANEEKKMLEVKEKRQFYTEELEKISFKQEEITRATRIRLEKDAEMLELEIRKTRANILMNSEKIDYNYQVLQKRNEENVIINNQQKRRVGKFNESIVVMRRKLSTLREHNKLVMEKLSQDIQKLHASINELQLKAEQFRKSNRKKFTKVWSLNFKEVKNLLSQVFEIDRILYEQQLARRWEKPDIDFEKLDYTQEKVQAKPNTPSTFVKSRSSALRRNSKTPQSSKKINQRQLNDILHKISDRAGFLIEERLLEILKPYTDEEKCLVRVENIFAALHITDIEVVENLVKYFEPYSWCPNCSSGLSEGSLQSLYTFKRTESKKEIKSSENSTPPPCSNHKLVMEPALVLTALNEFTRQQVKKRGQVAATQRISSPDANEVDLLQFDEAHIRSYWQQFMTHIPDEKQNVWKTVEHGLNHYLEVLKKRSQLDGECVFLQKQNAELKHLLQKL